jgi:hypothetical protein
MQIPKEQILEFLRSQGKENQVGQADQELPDKVDTEQHAGLLEKFGIDIGELTSKLPGGLGDKLPGGLGDKLPDGLGDKLPGGLGDKLGL